MHVTYSTPRVEKIFEDKKEFAKRIQASWRKTLVRCMLELNSAETYGDYRKTAKGKPHPLKGYPVPTVGIHITANVRLVIELDASPATVDECTAIIIKGVADYHGSHETWYIS